MFDVSAMGDEQERERTTPTIPDKTEFRKIGGSIFLKIPPNRASFFDLEEMKDEEGPDKKEAEFQPEKGPHGKYGSFWNPKQQEEKER